MIILDKLEYFNKKRDEEVFCEDVEEAGRIFAIEVANRLITDEEVDSFIRNLPLPTTERRKLCVSRVKADINNALIKRDTYEELTTSKSSAKANNGDNVIMFKPQESGKALVKTMDDAA